MGFNNPRPIIEVHGLAKTLDSGSHRVEILRGIDLVVPKGQFVSIMGPSGSGKSTLLGLLAGLDTPTAGEILLDGEEIHNLAEDDMALLRGRKIGFVFQSYHLVPTLTAAENVLLPLELAGDGYAGTGRARDLLERVGLGDRQDHYPVQLSGGEQQRVAIARAFAAAPPLILADEPTGNLDTANGRHVLDMLVDLNRRENATLILVTHDQELSSRADRLIRLRDGVIDSDGIAHKRRPPSLFPSARPESAMRNGFSWRVAARIAWRDTRASTGKFLFVDSCRRQSASVL